MLFEKEIKEIKNSVDHMIKTTVAQMKEIKDYVVAHQPDHEDDDGHVGVGRAVASISWQRVLFSLLELIEPLIDLIRDKYPRLFKVVDWCIHIIKKIFKNK